MKRTTFLLLAMLSSIGAGPRDALSEARQLYNKQQYDGAIKAAAEASREPSLADTAWLVIARAHLERFRQSGDAPSLVAARDAISRVHQAQLTPLDRIDLTIALGEFLYLDERAGAAAEEFEIALGRVDQAHPDTRESILEWWANALDRQAQVGPKSEQRVLYARIVRRMEEELSLNSGSAVASYWLVAGARGTGDLERAWDAALAGWIRAPLTGDRRVAFRADLDRLVSQAIIPERARQISPPADVVRTVASMRTEWDALKEAWTDR